MYRVLIYLHFLITDYVVNKMAKVMLYVFVALLAASLIMGAPDKRRISSQLSSSTQSNCGRHGDPVSIYSCIFSDKERNNVPSVLKTQYRILRLIKKTHDLNYNISKNFLIHSKLYYRVFNILANLLCNSFQYFSKFVVTYYVIFCFLYFSVH